MGEQATTTSLREQAITAVETVERERAERQAAEQACWAEQLVSLAGRVAVEILGQVAEGARWSALDERRATARIGGEVFRFETGIDLEHPHVLHHVATCSACGQDRTARIYSLESLGALLRDADGSRYHCDTCATAARVKREQEAEQEAEARRAAEADLPPLPTATDREHALRDAAAYHQLAKDRFGQGDEDGAIAAAAVSQSASALARAIQQDVQAWGESE